MTPVQIAKYLQNGLFSSLPYLLMLIGVISSGILSDYIAQRRLLTTRNSRYYCTSYTLQVSTVTTFAKPTICSRKLFHAIGLASTTAGCISLSFIGCNQTLVIVILVISTGLNGFAYSGYAVSSIGQNIPSIFIHSFFITTTAQSYGPLPQLLRHSDGHHQHNGQCHGVHHAGCRQFNHEWKCEGNIYSK